MTNPIAVPVEFTNTVVAGKYLLVPVVDGPAHPPEPAPVPVVNPLLKGDLGIDISTWQKVVDFGVVKASGRRVVIVRRTMGATGIDDMGAAHWNAASKVGFDYMGMYHLLIRGVAAMRQVENSLRNGAEGNYPLTLDLEPLSSEIKAWEANGKKPVNVAQTISDTKSAMYAFWDRYDYPPMCYTNEAALTVLGLQNEDWLSDFPLHVAAYTTSLTPAVPGIWKRAGKGFAVHQFDAGGQTWSQSVPGVTGKCDQNRYSGLPLF